MTRNLKKLICVLLAVTLLGVASAIVLAEINKSADKTSATPVDENAGRIDEPIIEAPTEAPVDVEDIEAPIDERIESKDAPIEVKPSSIMEISPFPTDAKAFSLDDMDEPAQILMPILYGMESSTSCLPHIFEMPDNYIAGFIDMLADMEFIPVSGDEMVAEAEEAILSRDEATLNRYYESVCMWIYYEEGDVMIDVTFYRSTEDAVWLPYFRCSETAVNMTTEEYNEEVEEIKSQSWETGLYMINPETLDAQVLETVTTMALGCSLDEYIDFYEETEDLIYNYFHPKPDGNKDNFEYGRDSYDYYMERFPYANIVK